MHKRIILFYCSGESPQGPQPKMHCKMKTPKLEVFQAPKRGITASTPRRQLEKDFNPGYSDECKVRVVMTSVPKPFMKVSLVYCFHFAKINVYYLPTIFMGSLRVIPFLLLLKEILWKPNWKDAGEGEYLSRFKENGCRMHRLRQTFPVSHCNRKLICRHFIRLLLLLISMISAILHYSLSITKLQPKWEAWNRHITLMWL